MGTKSFWVDLYIRTFFKIKLRSVERYTEGVDHKRLTGKKKKQNQRNYLYIVRNGKCYHVFVCVKFTESCLNEPAIC